MPMQFCPKCKGIIIPRTIKGRTLLLCNGCGWWKEVKGEKGLIEVDKIVHDSTKGEGVVDDENILATYKHKCEKCGYEKAEIQDIGVQYSDEDNVMLVKCGKCGFVERIGEAS